MALNFARLVVCILLLFSNVVIPIDTQSFYSVSRLAASIKADSVISTQLTILHRDQTPVMEIILDTLQIIPGNIFITPDFHTPDSADSGPYIYDSSGVLIWSGV